MKKAIILFYLLGLVSISLYSQERFSVNLYVGKSDVRLHSEENNVLINYYTPYNSFKAGLIYDLTSSDSGLFYGSGGILFSVNGLRFNMPDGQVWPGTSKSYRTERYYYIDVPVYLNYKFEEWLIFKAGIKGSLNVGTQNILSGMEAKTFTFGLSGGATLKINRFTLIGEYSYDLTDALKLSSWFWKYSVFHIGIGYYFSL